MFGTSLTMRRRRTIQFRIRLQHLRWMLFSVIAVVGDRESWEPDDVGVSRADDEAIWQVYVGDFEAYDAWNSNIDKKYTDKFDQARMSTQQNIKKNICYYITSSDGEMLVFEVSFSAEPWHFKHRGQEMKIWDWRLGDGDWTEWANSGVFNDDIRGDYDYAFQDRDGQQRPIRRSESGLDQSLATWEWWAGGTGLHLDGGKWSPITDEVAAQNLEHGFTAKKGIVCYKIQKQSQDQPQPDEISPPPDQECHFFPGILHTCRGEYCCYGRFVEGCCAVDKECGRGGCGDDDSSSEEQAQLNTASTIEQAGPFSYYHADFNPDMCQYKKLCGSDAEKTCAVQIAIGDAQKQRPLCFQPWNQKSKEESQITVQHKAAEPERQAETANQRAAAETQRKVAADANAKRAAELAAENQRKAAVEQQAARQVAEQQAAEQLAARQATDRQAAEQRATAVQQAAKQAADQQAADTARQAEAVRQAETAKQAADQHAVDTATHDEAPAQNEAEQQKISKQPTVDAGLAKPATAKEQRAEEAPIQKPNGVKEATETLKTTTITTTKTTTTTARRLMGSSATLLGICISFVIALLTTASLFMVVQ